MAEGQYLSINKYITLLKKNFDRVNKIEEGFFYTYQYLFNKNPDYDYQKNHEIYKFYDFFPATFVFGVNEDTKTFTGINFHHLPVYARKLWLSRVKKMWSRKFKMEGTHEIDLPYEVSTAIYKKSKFAVRQYRYNLVRDLRIIPNEHWDKVMEIYGKTYYGVTISNIKSEFLKYNPN